VKPIIFIVMLMTGMLPNSLMAASFHWVDSNGFHSVDQITKVPVEQRMELPMVKNRTALPFTADEDKDGSMHIWYLLNLSGVAAPYTKASTFPASRAYTKTDQPKAGDIGCGKSFCAVLINNDKFQTATEKLSRQTFTKKHGQISWYRFSGKHKVTTRKGGPAPRDALNKSDKALLRLDKTAEHPLQVKDPAEIERLKQAWQQAVSQLEAVRQNYPDDPQVIRRLGVLYRRGFTLEMPGAWERAEAYLLRTTTLIPKSADAFISLGILYGDSGEGFEKQAETQFRKALKLANKQQLPHVLWGLSVAQFKQGRKADAIKTLDRLIKLKPGDKRALKLREKFMESGSKPQGQ